MNQPIVLKAISTHLRYWQRTRLKFSTTTIYIVSCFGISLGTIIYAGLEYTIEFRFKQKLVTSVHRQRKRCVNNHSQHHGLNDTCNNWQSSVFSSGLKCTGGRWFEHDSQDGVQASAVDKAVSLRWGFRWLDSGGDGVNGEISMPRAGKRLDTVRLIFQKLDIQTGFINCLK